MKEDIIYKIPVVKIWYSMNMQGYPGQIQAESDGGGT